MDFSVSFKVTVVDGTLKQPLVSFYYKPEETFAYLENMSVDEAEDEMFGNMAIAKTDDDFQDIRFGHIRDKIKERVVSMTIENMCMFYFDSDGDLIMVNDMKDYHYFICSKPKTLFVFDNKELKLSAADLGKKMMRGDLIKLKR